jgi:TetR/AcrR family transcriptional regulator, regulator of cefoperazone and chloramphenicol sensitivity
MTSRVIRKPKPSPRSVRSDGAETRLHILQVAGQLFAAKGFERTTSREICSAAGSNLAAVNYHFGSRDGLYEAVLVEAHGQIVGIDDLESISRSGASPEAKIRELIALIVGRSSATNLPWGLRVLVREFMSPSTHVNALLKQAVLPKLSIVLTMVAEFLGVPQEHPLVQRALAFVVLPCIMLVVAPRPVLRQALPALLCEPAALAEDMGNYALAGLSSLASSHAKD